MTEIAKISEARFQWWVQKTFNVLPTDSRYLDLTMEQLDLMYEHFLLDNPLPNEGNNKARDGDYDKEYSSTDRETDEDVPNIPDNESFSDPDFDSAWNNEDESGDIDNIEENIPPSGVPDEDLSEDGGGKSDINSEEWEEV